ncbi:MAG: DUF1559 domain-containing protein [Fimbriimonadaceae bacterium]|nr:DUF1559 domain-containing protein [Chthonomonadaceae bacterium]MCO5297832.1 DUF1559 domain-containing protein [Fimbriimonadaceae bacterium]
MKKAFTLIELLVVIAIIAILAAILFPVFAQAKEAAKKVSCLSNMKQVAIAVYLYAGDYDDTAPQTSWETSATPQPFNPGGRYQIHWTYLMQPYIKNYQIFACPSDGTPVKPKYPAPNGTADLGMLNAAGQMYCDWQAPEYSYIPNYNLMPAHDWLPVSMTVLPAPADTIAVAERREKTDSGVVIGKHKGLSGFNPSQPCPGSTQIAPQYAIITSMNFAFWTPEFIAQHNALDSNDKADVVRVKWDRHKEGANYAYADGHARWQRLAQTLNPDKYQYGDHFYPAYAPYNGGPCSN